MSSPQNREEMLLAAALKEPVDKRDAFLKDACAHSRRFQRKGARAERRKEE